MSETIFCLVQVCWLAQRCWHAPKLHPQIEVVKLAVYDSLKTQQAVFLRSCCFQRMRRTLSVHLPMKAITASIFGGSPREHFKYSTAYSNDLSFMAQILPGYEALTLLMNEHCCVLAQVKGL